jgi:hypothetical protein
VGGEEDSARQQSRQRNGVERGNVIGDNENARSGGGETLKPVDFGAEKQPQSETHQKERQNPPQPAGYRSDHKREHRRKTTGGEPEMTPDGAKIE